MKDQWEIMDRHRRKAPVAVHSVARELGITVREGRWEANYSGMIRRDRKRGGSTGFAIIVNEGHGAARQRFPVAHEIGRYVLHRENIGAGVADDPLYRSGLPSPMETQANEFAGWLLMPWELILEKVRSGVGSVEELAQIFEVSNSAMSVRVGFPYETD